jgi:hypothetical protein
MEATLTWSTGTGPTGGHATTATTTLIDDG